MERCAEVVLKSEVQIAMWQNGEFVLAILNNQNRPIICSKLNIMF